MPRHKPIFLSKSKLTAYHQCRKRLWLEVHRPELRVDSAMAQKSFSVGHVVGDLARREFPDGVLIGPENPDQPIIWPQVFAQTREALAANPRRPIFEATCRHAGVLVRADILAPTDRGWHMAEVKSATSVKPYHLDDVAVQTWVMRRDGVEIETVELRHIDNHFVYPGDGRYGGLFRTDDIQNRVEDLQAEVPRWIADAKSVAGSSEPMVAMGDQCTKPFVCPFTAYCANLAGPQPEYPVSLLPGTTGKALARALAAEGYNDLREVPADRVTSPDFAIIHNATLSGVAYFDAAGAGLALAGLDYPRFYFDFETIDFAVPIWAGTRPYEKTPFQWSCHVERSPGTFEYRHFLDLSGNDPSRACAESLLRALETTGPVLAYNAGFEKGVLEALAARFPDLAPALAAVIDRLADPLPVIRRHYYHREMRGSRSLKMVLPTIAPDLGYDQLDEVKEGADAQSAYLEAITADVTDSRRDEIRDKLLTYCERDTWAIVVLTWFLEGRGRPTSIHR